MRVGGGGLGLLPRCALLPAWCVPAHPSRPGAQRSTVWTVKARTSAVRALGRQLKGDGIEMVTLGRVRQGTFKVLSEATKREQTKRGGL